MSGPATGYDFGSKRHYRRTVWNFADECLARIPRRARRVLILDTAEAEETLFLVKTKGYHPANIHAVNRNPAEVAWLTRRLASSGIRGVHTHGTDAFKVLHELTPNLDAINLDLTGSVTPKLMDNLASLKLHDNLFLAVTALRGREKLRESDRATGIIGGNGVAGLTLGNGPVAGIPDHLLANAQATLLKLLPALEKNIRAKGPASDGLADGMDIQRIVSLLDAPTDSIHYHTKMRWGRYRSTAGNQTMLWLARHFRAMSIAEFAMATKRFEKQFVAAAKGELRNE